MVTPTHTLGCTCNNPRCTRRVQFYTNQIVVARGNSQVSVVIPEEVIDALKSALDNLETETENTCQ